MSASTLRWTIVVLGGVLLGVARYEVLLTRAGGSWQVERWQRHFYDIAGVDSWKVRCC